MENYLQGVAVLDIEATSLDTRNGAIASIGLVTFKDGKLVRFYRAFWPFNGAKIDESALKVNGFTLKQLNNRCNCKNPADCKLQEHMHDPAEVTLCLERFMRENNCHTIAGQNPAFDTNYANAYFERYKKFNFMSHRNIDLHSIAYAYIVSNGIDMPTDSVSGGGHDYKRNDLSATKVYKMLGMPMEPRPHNALTGAVFEFEALCRLVYGKPVLEEFKKYSMLKKIL